MLSLLVNDADVLQQLQTLKGLVFALASAALVFFTCYKGLNSRRRQLHRLGQSEQMLYLVQSHCTMGTWEYREDFFWNPAALKILGRDSNDEQASLAHLLTWLHPSERGAVQRAVQALIDSQIELNVCARLSQPAQQQPVWILLHGEVSADGRILGTVQDISEQKHAESALHESEMRFRQLFEQTPRIAVQGYDRDNRVIFWNEASAQLYGYNINEVLGRRMEELIIPPLQRSKMSSASHLWQRNGSAVSTGEIQLQRKDGSMVWVHSSQLVIRNRLDQLEKYHIDIDLTEQKKMHQELLVSESRYRALVNHLADAIFIIDSNNHLSFLNPAWEQISGHNINESLGSPLHRFIPELGHMPLIQHLDDLRNGVQSNLRLECQMLTDKGQVRRVELQLNRSEPDGCLHGSLRDVQERYQTQHLQQARNAVLDKLLGHKSLEDILDVITRSLEAIQPDMRVSIMLLDSQHCLYIGSAPSLPQNYCQAIDGIQANPGVGSCGHAAYTGELVIAEDISTHPNWQGYQDLALSSGLQACWSLPFKDDCGNVLGTFGVYYPRPASPSQADITLVTEFTRLAGLAVQSCGRQEQAN
ncbi:PAS domain S-box protein [Ectopseudomonas mendocina]|uniref:histidine kinase n=1 Tax=Ectopseudomonas mendocina TaxID=300 RepID=A0ABZ2RIA4_ECTME